MSKLTTRTIKLEIFVWEEDKEIKSKHWEYIRNLAYQSYRYKNMLYRFYQTQNELKESLKAVGEKVAVLNEAYGKSPQAYAASLLKDQFKLPSTITDAISMTVKADYSNDFKEMYSGNRSARNYKRTNPIPIRERAFTNFDGNSFVLFPSSKIAPKIKFGINYGRDKSNNRETVRRVVDVEYKFCDSSIKIDGTKIYLLMVIQHEKLGYALDKDKVVGVDVGINFPAYVALNEGLKRSAIGNKRELLKHRTQMQARRRRTQAQLVLSAGGKGRGKKLSAMDRVRDCERNFVKTYNHQISKKVIDFALKHNAGMIRLENLSGFKETGGFILRNWSYHELQTMIEYKAGMYNIDVEYINPKHTSQSCSACGHTEKENRKSQKFKCKSCDTEMNADYNAAVNIARGGIYKTESSTVQSSKSTGERRPSRAVSRPKAEGCGHSVIQTGAKQLGLQF